MSAMFQLRNPRLLRALALAGAFIALSPATAAQSVTGTPTTSSSSATPVPSCCGTTPTSTPSGAPAESPSPGGTPTPSRHAGRHLSDGEIAVAALAALLALGCAAWGLARRRAFEPRWWLSLRHAMAEAGFRASATWAEFADWVRIGH
jgi:hypothetical protein